MDKVEKSIMYSHPTCGYCDLLRETIKDAEKFIKNTEIKEEKKSEKKSEKKKK